MRVLLIVAASCLLAACSHFPPRAAKAPAAPVEPDWVKHVPPQIKNYAVGEAFLEKNATAPGVKSLESGVQYKVVRSGPETGTRPTPEDEVVIHYEGKLLDGKVFDSSYARNEKQTFVLGQLIPGWVEAVQMMRPGDEWILYIPPHMAYGPRDSGPIPAYSVLEFRIELFEVHGAQGADGAEFH